MAETRPALRDDLARLLEALDRGPHTPDDLAEASGVTPDHLEPRLDELLDRGWIFRWSPEEPPLLALTWRGRYELQRSRFQAAAAASLGVGLAFAAALAAWTAWTLETEAAATPTAGPAHGPTIVAALAALAALLLLAALRLDRSVTP